jgi:hypothetical protein
MGSCCPKKKQSIFKKPAKQSGGLKPYRREKINVDIGINDLQQSP